MISNLTKIDYFRSRNIPCPKPCLKLEPEPVPMKHYLTPLAPYDHQIKRLADKSVGES